MAQRQGKERTEKTHRQWSWSLTAQGLGLQMHKENLYGVIWKDSSPGERKGPEAEGCRQQRHTLKSCFRLSLVTGQYGDKFSSGSHEKVRALKWVWKFLTAKSGVPCSGGVEGA